MTVGFSGSFAINGTELLLFPTEFGWMPRSPLGYTGDGHPEYGGDVREFSFRWNIDSASEFHQLIDFFNSTISTGTVSADLPQWDNAGYLFYRYTGCVVSEPEMGRYFTEHPSDVKLIISNIRTL